MILDISSTFEESPPCIDVVEEDIMQTLAKYGGDSTALISILGEIQEKYNYLPEEALRIVAEKTGRSLVDVYGVATFYRAFSLKPRGRHVISVCKGTACHVRGGERVAEEFERQLGIKAGDTTPDMEFTLETVNCLGACALGPIVAVDGHYFSKVDTGKVVSILDKAREGLDDMEDEGQVFPVQVSCPNCGASLMDDSHKIDEHPSVLLQGGADGYQGWIRLSSLYGNFSGETELEIPVNGIAVLRCPKCKQELTGTSDCPDCGAPMAMMQVDGGGMVQVCTRRGCRSHILDAGRSAARMVDSSID